MNLNRLLLPIGVMSGLLTSCIYPYPPNPEGPLPGQSPDPAASDQSISSVEQENIRALREQARARERERERAAGSGGSSDPPTNPDPSPPPKKDYRTATPIPGKEGFVFNPFTNEPVDVRAIPPGTLVRDPNDPDAEHKFRVP